MEIKKQVFTPELAEELLRSNTDNRRFRKTVVEKYADEMLMGRWKENTGEVIKISDNGTLLDGQHRLMAIVKAGIPIALHVAYGLQSDVFHVLDSGIPRNATDAFHIQSIPNASMIPATISYYEALISQKIENKQSPSTSELLDRYYAKELFWSETARKSNNWYAEFGKIISPSTIGAIYALFHDKSPDDAEKFMDQLCSGMDVRNKSVALLRKKLIDDKLAIKKMPRRIKFALIIKAWNFFRKMESVKMLRFDPDREEFPTAM
ncbi:hypothetical protein [Pedobacter sp.]|uniref:hypothetical protein n=1 Tax=Pedobacter sp. TaxID=1411316 RepID=UPI003C391E75